MKITTLAWALLGLLVVLIAGGWLFKDALLVRLAGWTAPGVAENRAVEWQKGPDKPLASPTERAPNIVLIVVDDLGFNDISLNGGGLGKGTVRTPHIDALAREGAVMGTAYAAHGTSAPSRAAIMTGRYPTRFGFEYAPNTAMMARVWANQKRDDEVDWVYNRDKVRGAPKLKDMGLPASETTLAELLAQRGYHTVHLGKWGLGAAKGMRPEDQGFNESLGFMGTAQKYALATAPDVVGARLEHEPADRFNWSNLAYGVQYNGSKPFRPDGYMTDYLSDEAVKVIEANRNRAFFLYMAYNAPQLPLQALRTDYEALGHISDHNERVYAAMVVALDRGVGRIMQALKDQGLDHNTLVIFTSSSGASSQIGIERLNAPYRGWNRSFFEGGVRVPLFMRWPRMIDAGTQVAQPVSHVDLFATAAVAARAPLPAYGSIDGVDLGPYIRKELTNSVHEALFWRAGGYRAVRSGKWKLQVQHMPFRVWLYDLEADPGEMRNLAETRPEVVDYLTTRLQIHDQQQMTPLWPSLLQVPVGLDKSAKAKLLASDAYVMWSD